MILLHGSGIVEARVPSSLDYQGVSFPPWIVGNEAPPASFTPPPPFSNPPQGHLREGDLMKSISQTHLSMQIQVLFITLVDNAIAPSKNRNDLSKEDTRRLSSRCC